MPEFLPYDVFLSHSSKDKHVVRSLAEKLRSDGLRVWFDEWEILPGDSIPAKIEEGLERSRILLLCMSANAFGSDWAQLEAGTFRFRDPLNKDRRFLPLRLDDTRPKGSLAQFLYVDWRADSRGQEYPKLFAACRQTSMVAERTHESQQSSGLKRSAISLGHSDSVLSVAFSPDGRLALSGSSDNTLRLWEVETGRSVRVLEGHSASVWSVAFSPDGRLALSGSADNTLRLWEVETGRSVRVLEGHSDSVLSVAFSPDGRLALSGSADNTLRLWEVETGRSVRVLEGHSDRVWSVAFSPDGRLALSGSADNTLRLWEVETGRSVRVLEGHSDRVWSVAFSPDGRLALSGSADNTLRLWEVETGRSVRVLEGHSDRVLSMAFSPDGRLALSGSADNTLRLWEVETGRSVRVLEGHSDTVLSVAFSPDGRLALSGSDDNTLRLWEVETGRSVRVLEGHSDTVLSVAFSPDGRLALSGSSDNTLRLWEVETGRSVRVLEGHSDNVWSVAFSPDGRLALSGSEDNTLRLWEVETGRSVRVLEGHSDTVLSVAFSPDGRLALSAASNGIIRIWDWAAGLETENKQMEQVEYANAKVLLVGDSGAGKTGLSVRLAKGEWRPSESTLGAWATQWPMVSAGGGEREIWLWDFGGQADQRLIHQLYMDATAVAVLVFDGQKQDVFDTLGQWDRDLTRASRRPFRKLLVAGRVDTGSILVSRGEIEKFATDRNFLGHVFETSAKTGEGCQDLKEAIVEAVQWDELAWRTSPRLFKRLKVEIVRLKDEGRVLMRFNELREVLLLRLAGEEIAFTDEDFKAVLGLLAAPGVLWQLDFGNWILLQPEFINLYAQAVIQTMRADKEERGCISEEQVLRGELKYPSDPKRLATDDEQFVLLAMHQTLVHRGLCFRERSDKGWLLIFPSYYRRERPQLVGHPAVLVSYQFNGFLDEVYATLVVRLHHTEAFERHRLWRYAADFKTLTDKPLGIKMTRRAEGAGELEVYFDPSISDGEKIVFARYVHEHLREKAQDLVRLRHYVCPHCCTPVGNREVAMERLNEWLSGKRTTAAITGVRKKASGGATTPSIVCAKCDKRVPLWDELEARFASEEVQQRVREMGEDSSTKLDNESKERALVGEVISTVALAGQICREFSISDHGIDMEIEFKHDSGEASGRKLYLQLKSGDSHLRTRERDESEIFTLKDERHARYWIAQAFPVMLVIRSSAGETRWMEVGEWLKEKTRSAQAPPKQIPFRGERFDVMSVRKWRERILRG